MIRLEFDLSGLPVSISSDVPAIVEAFETAWKPFRVIGSQGSGQRLLDVVVLEDSKSFLNVEPISKDIRCAMVGARLEIHSRDAVASAGADGSCQVTVGVGPPMAQFYAVSNVLLAAMAWRLPQFGCVLLHAAALVVDQRAFVLVGPSGAGKSTWAWSGKADGAGFVSDDIVALQILESGVGVLSFPFRGNHPTPLPPARWALGAVLLPKWGHVPALEGVSPFSAHVAIEASVLFRDVLQDRGAVASIIDAILALPIHAMVFGPRGAFVDVLRKFQ